jgi:GNAT superfamily N-acetyltransferase
MPPFATKPLDPTTWLDFATLVERHNGVWSGCWCMSFHAEGKPNARSPDERRSDKEARVHEGRAHAALVYDGAVCIGWCQFGSTEELPRIKNGKVYREGLTKLPDWRITCFFVDKAYRGQGVADAALKGALREIGQLGGGAVESYPEDVAGRTTASAFLHNGTLGMFERHGFKPLRRIGKNHWVVAKTVRAWS